MNPPSSPPTLVIPGKPKPYLLAHRGNRVRCPENTLAAFRQALADGADALETDLHLTADGVFVCIHDATVDRTTDGRGPVANLTLAELAGLLPADVALALELKTDRFLEPEVCQRLVDELAAAGVRNRIVVLSFSLARVQAVQRVAPDLPVGWITLSRAWPIPGVHLLGPLWPLLLLNPLYPWLAHRRGQLVAPLDPTPDRRLWLYKLLRCDAVLSDDPASTRAALGRT